MAPKAKAEPKEARGKADAKAKAAPKAKAKAKARQPEAATDPDCAVVESPQKKARGESTKPSAASASTPGWEEVDSAVVRDFGSPASSRVAGFDMDGTLIKTKSGKAFPTSKDDWVLWAPQVATKLQALQKDGVKVVLITNQGGIAKGKSTKEEITSKIEGLQKAVATPFLAMILTQDDLYRKPLPTAWKLIEERFNGGTAVDKASSFFCGDAAGRQPPVVPKKDFSAGDLKFALNVGVPFKTPEEFFLGKSQAFEREKFAFDPRTLGVSPIPLPVPKNPERQTLFLTVGPPGCGKSSLATQHLTTCVRVNQDTLKTKEKCHKAVEEALKAGKSVVVDNQNRAKSDRAPYVALAKKAGASPVAVSYEVPKELCFHLNAYRMLHKTSDLHRAEKVPDMVIHAFYKNKEEPTTAEGFDQVHRVGLEHFAVVGGADLSLLRSFLS